MTATPHPARYGRLWRIAMPDGKSLFDRDGYPLVWTRKRDAQVFLLANPNPQQPKRPEPRALLAWGAGQ